MTAMPGYAGRRARLAAAMQPGAVAIVPTAPEALRNGDSEYPYRHDSYFYYLTGFDEPEAVLVLAQGKAILFCRPRDPEREIWDGLRHGPDGAREAFGFDEAYAVGELDARMPGLLADASALYYASGKHAQVDAQLARWLDAVRQRARSGVTAPETVHNVRVLLDEMRLIKDDAEQALMRRAALVSSRAHERAMRATRTGMREYEIEAELLYEFRRNGAQSPAYTPIVASGPNACILHYNQNRRQVADGDLVLIDAGCELDGYASDITRTYPASGRFSAPQQALYELVLAAQAAAMAEARPGLPYSGMHDAALRVLAQGMVDLKLVPHASADDAIAERAHQQFYMHGTGHWLGMDVHDCGSYRDLQAEGRPSRALAPGMVLTVEPGIYVRPAQGVPEQYWNIGIRIEDDVLVTAGACDVLSDAPKLVADIEHLMQR
ncbi:aminopeptidase P N-terminal domain-containing protein [Pseudoduganella sp. GCM10020061]|uniref:aminopeptidase P N-terminal domain-containing protein n=1 Tax=Pseudoduganella sp. GCM10020061 TaxID=3317345 RepID=UPI003638119D